MCHENVSRIWSLRRSQSIYRCSCHLSDPGKTTPGTISGVARCGGALGACVCKRANRARRAGRRVIGASRPGKPEPTPTGAKRAALLTSTVHQLSTYPRFPGDEPAVAGIVLTLMRRAVVVERSPAGAAHTQTACRAGGRDSGTRRGARVGGVEFGSRSGRPETGLRDSCVLCSPCLQRINTGCDPSW